MAGEVYEQTLSRAACRERGFRIFGWCPAHAWRESDLRRPSKVDNLRLHSLFMRAELKCGKCGDRLTALRIDHYVNSSVGQAALVEWRLD